MAARSDDTPPTVITLRPLGSALPLGVFALGVGMLLLAALTGKWIPVDQTADVGILVAAFVFPLQLASSLLGFLSRDVFAGTTFGVLCTSWLALGLVLVTAAPGARSAALGIFLLAFGAVMASLALVAMTGKPVIGAMLTFVAARAALSGLYELGAPTALNEAASVAAVIAGGLAWYAGVAFLLEDLRHQPVLPTLRRGVSREAAPAHPGPPARRVRGDAGVREQL